MAATIRCPKCKTEQPKQPICSHCGFDIRAYAIKLSQQRAAAGAKGASPSGTPTITCPKCKTRQPKQPICSHCGFDIRAYALKLKQRQAVQPQRPAVQPQQPAVQPQQPAVQPQRPAVQPQRPAVQPQQPAAQPQQPATQPQRPATQPQRPATQPQRPAAQPQRPTAQPQRPAAQPQRPAAQPQKPTTQPQKPVAQLQKPAAQSQGPAPDTTQKPLPNLEALEALRKRVAEEASAPEKLFSVSELFWETWEVYKGNLRTLLALSVLNIVFTALPFVIFAGGGVGLAFLVSEMKVPAIFGGSILGVTFALLGMSWGLASMTAGVVHKRLGVKEALGHGWEMLWPYIWLISLAWYAITGGMMLLFIPGLIFLVWAFPAQFMLFTENERGMEALLKSREYVRGYWFDTFIKLFVIWLCMAVASFSMIGQLFFFPFMMIYMFKMFMNLRRIKGSVIIYSTSMKNKLVWLGTGTLGLVLPLILVFMLAGPTVKASFTELMNIVESRGLQLQGDGLNNGIPASKGMVTPSKDTYVAGESISITYTGLPGNQRDWITLVDASSPDKRYGKRFFTNGNVSGSYTFTGVQPGTYELRVYYNWPDGGFDVQDRYRITVIPKSPAQ